MNTVNKQSPEQSLQESRDALAREHEELSRLFKLVVVAKQEWEKAMDCVDDIVILTDRHGTIRRCNKAFKDFTGKRYEDLLDRDCVELLVGHGIEIDTLHGRELEVFHRPRNRWYRISTSLIIGEDADQVAGSVVTLHDSTDIRLMTQKLEQNNRELEDAYSELKLTQSKILQQEKMASIGQLAAGVAHEINNPMGFISSNLGTLSKYLDRVYEYLDLLVGAADKALAPGVLGRIEDARKRLKVDFIMDDTRKLIAESLDGAERVKTIVRNLKSFSRVDQAEAKLFDVNECIETTLNIVWNELKYKATVKKEYGALPVTMCYPQQLNQVFMNLLVNAGQAIEEQGEITLRTRHENGSIFASVSDTGAGISPDKLALVFEPFFTTKEVGKGTGLGLSITYDIVKKHDGEITVESEPGKGTTFTVRLPVKEKI